MSQRFPVRFLTRSRRVSRAGGLAGASLVAALACLGMVAAFAVVPAGATPPAPAEPGATQLGDQAVAGTGGPLSWTGELSAPPAPVERFTPRPSPVTSAGFTPQIVGGQAATTVPSASVALIVFGSGGSAYSCSGALVAPQWVLTAAHCLVQFAGNSPTRTVNDPAGYQVYVGTNSSGPASSVSQIVLNDGYLQRASAEDVPGYRDGAGVWRNGTPALSNDTGLDDFGLLQLSSAVAASPLRLATDDSLTQAGRVVWAAGWGLTSFPGELPSQLQEAQLTMANSSYCEIAWHRYFSATSSACYQGLAELGQNAATCNGDSGGPVLSRDESGAWWIAAVISGGPSNCPLNQPYVGARSAWVAPWVTAITGADVSGRAGESINPMVPRRIVDSRVASGVSFIPPTVYEPSTLGIFLPQPTLPAGFVTRRPLYGPNGVSTLPVGGVAGVILNVTVDAPTGPGYLAVFPCVDGWAGTSNLNYTAGQTVANFVVSKVDRNGDVCFLASERTALIVDVTGWLGYDNQANRAATSASPVRLTDTRDTAAKVPAGGVLEVQATGPGGAPAGAAAAVLNITSTQTDAAGYVTAFPCNSGNAESSTLNPAVGLDVANAAVVPLDASGRACLFSATPTHLVVDLNGWVSDAAGGTMKTLIPARLADTRLVRPTRWPGGTPLILHVTGVGGVPATGVDSVVLNVTVTSPIAGGYLVVYPCGEVPIASNVNFAADQTVPNGVLAKVDGSGNVCFLSPIDTHLVVDVFGYARV